MSYEYLVCMVQKGRITFANGKWVGSGQPSEQTQEARPARTLGQFGKLGGCAAAAL